MGPPGQPRKTAQWLQSGEGQVSLLEGAPSILRESDPVPGKRLGNSLLLPGRKRGHADAQPQPLWPARTPREEEKR